MSPRLHAAEVSFLGYEDILAIHNDVPNDPRHPEENLRGVMSQGDIEAAIGRAHDVWHTEDPDLADRAAAYLRMAQDHAFVQANKRTAFAVADSFLRINGWHVHAEQAEIVRFMLELALGRHDLPALARWIRVHAQPTGDLDGRL